MKRDDLWRWHPWRRVVFHRTMTHLSAALVLSAAAAGLYQDRVYFMFASCAAGVILIARAWLAYCRWSDPCKKEDRMDGKIPYLLKKEKSPHRHKPAFLMNAGDFDDDLTPRTAVDEEIFTDAQRTRAHIAAFVLSGCVMLLLSFIL